MNDVLVTIFSQFASLWNDYLFQVDSPFGLSWGGYFIALIVLTLVGDFIVQIMVPYGGEIAEDFRFQRSIKRRKKFLSRNKK